MAACLGLVAPGLLLALPARAQHVTDGLFTTPSEWDTSRSSITTQSYSLAPNGSGGSKLYAEHVYPSNPADPNSYDMLYMMADYTGSAPGATAANSTFSFFFQESALYCQGDYLITFGPGGVTAYEQNYYNTVLLNPDGTFYTGADSGWGNLDPDDFAGGNIQGAVGYGASPNDSSSHLMAEFGIALFEPYDGTFWQGIISPSPPTFFSFSESSSGSDPVVAAGYVTLSRDGSTSVSLTDPSNPDHSVIGSDGNLALLPPGQNGQQVNSTPEGGSIALLVGGLSAFSIFRLRRNRPVPGKRTRDAA